jgi:hypothetical protein
MEIAIPSFDKIVSGMGPISLRALKVASIISFLAGSLPGADLKDLLGLNKTAVSTNGLEGLSESQITSGLKQALSKGVETAIGKLGTTNGFLKDAQVRIPLPDTLKKLEKTLRAAGQNSLADDFVTTMNHAAEQAVPAAAGVLSESVQKMSVTDAKLILTSTNTAATDYFRRTSETNLHAKFLPIVKTATGKAGVTSAYKKMTEAATGGSLGALGRLGGSLLNKDTLDIDGYVTHKTLDGLFLKIAEQEKLIRQNPAARTSEILQKVFGAISQEVTNTVSGPRP